LVKGAHDLGFYTNLITSGMGMNEERLKTLKENGYLWGIAETVWMFLD